MKASWKLIITGGRALICPDPQNSTLHCSVQPNTVQHSIVQYSIVQYSTVRTVQYTAQYNLILYTCIVQYSTV